MRLCSIDVGVRNLAFVVLDVEPGGAAVVRAWVSASTVPASTCVRGMCKTDAVEAVVRALEERADELLECDTVLVEAQPRFSPLNVQTAHAIAAYFVVRKRVDLDEPVAVHLVHAGRKNAWAKPATPSAAAATRAAGSALASAYLSSARMAGVPCSRTSRSSATASSFDVAMNLTSSCRV